MSAYREESPRESEIAELRFVPRVASEAGIPTGFVIFLSACGLGATGWAAIALGSIGAGIAFLVTLGVSYVAWRNRRSGVCEVLLRIERGVLLVNGKWSISLAEIHDVEVDSNTIKSMQRDHERVVHRKGLGWDSSRIVLVGDETRAPVVITDDDVNHEDCVEYAAKVRRFLRSHGWEPIDERPPVSSS